MIRRPLRLWAGGLSALWDLLVGIFQGDEADNRGQIDPDG